MIINTLFSFLDVLMHTLVHFVTAPLVPISVDINMGVALDLMFDNFTMINMICHLSLLKVILSLIFAVWFFRKMFNLIRFLYSKAHTK